MDVCTVLELGIIVLILLKHVTCIAVTKKSCFYTPLFKSQIKEHNFRFFFVQKLSLFKTRLRNNSKHELSVIK